MRQATEDQRYKLQQAMWPLMSRGCGDFSPDQICRALHKAFDGDIDGAVACIHETKT